MAMIFEEREAYAIAEARAVEAVCGLDPELVAAERGIGKDFLTRKSGPFYYPE